MPKLSHLFTNFPNPITDTFKNLQKHKSADLFANTSPLTNKVAEDVANKMKTKEQKLVANTTDKMNRRKRGTRRRRARRRGTKRRGIGTRRR